MILSAVWGAGMISLLLIDILDIVLISLPGTLGDVVGGILDLTILIQSLIWIGLALLGLCVQRKIGYEPLPMESQVSGPVREPSRHRGWVIGILLGVWLIGLVAAGVIAANKDLRKQVQTSITNFEHSLGLEAEAPGDAPWSWAASLVRPNVILGEEDRILVFVHHPDDDILSAAGAIQQAVEKDIPVKVVIMTVGDYNETSFALYRKEITLDPVEAIQLGETRREEAVNAQGILGVAPEQVIFLGYPDGGGLEKFKHHWDENDPYQAILSQQDSLPSAIAQSSGVTFIGQNIVADIQQVIEEYQPIKLFTSHPGYLHPDQQTVLL